MDQMFDDKTEGCSRAIFFCFKPTTKDELQTAVNDRISDKTNAISTYGDIDSWDTSLITDMSYLFYEKVYNADRPELFFKATKNRIVGHKGNVRIRKDSNWNVPEPEFTLFITSNKKIVGYTIGNDMSSRDIEGENPLYLPQAKTYDGCASIGPSIYVIDKPISKDLLISMEIIRNDSIVFQETISLNKMKRDPEELVEYLYRECSFPNGSFLMTGTGIVPPNNFSLQINDIINIRIENIGELINIVK